MRRALWTVALVLVGALGLASCGDDETPGPEQARLEVDGRVTVSLAAGGTETVTDTATLAFGDVVVVDDGTATVSLAGGERYELRAGPDPSELEIGAPPTVLAGDVLVAEGFPAGVRYDTVTLSALGPLKVDASVPDAVSYAGRARIDGAGALDEIQGLRRVVLTASATPEPLVYDGSDAWDRRYLAEAVAFGDRLEALARGYTADLGPGGGRSAGFFEAVIPALDDEREFDDDLLDDRPPGETLVGAAIAVQGRDGPFRERWEQVFAFRDAGAAWGLVAADQGVSSAPLLDTIELAVTASTVPPPSSTTAPPNTTSSTAPGPGGSDPTTATTTTTAPSPTTEPPSPPSTGLLEPVLDPVDDIVDDLLGALGL